MCKYDGRDAIITLFNGERIKYNNKKIYCQRKLSPSNKIEKVDGTVLELVYGPKQCLLTTFRLYCPFYASKNNEKTVKYEIGIKNLVDQKIEFHEFSLSTPETIPRSFVSCMSRMIAYDDWALLLVALETFRFYGGDLMVAYIECALKKVFDLMKLYESDGILKIQHAYKSSDTPNIPYDSDGQIEYANQLTNSHQCLYEFKESAEFIAFTDWDDILIGLRINSGFGKFADGFRQLSLKHQFAAAFAVPRFQTNMKKTFQSEINPFSIEKTFNQIQYSTTENLPPKMVVRPKFVAGVWIHQLKVAENWRFHSITVNSATAVLLHLNNLISDIGIKEKYSTDSNSSNNSYTRLFHKLILNCYNKMEKYAMDGTIGYCPSYKACVFPKQNVSVIKIKTTHKPSKKMTNLIWHERDKIEFIENEKGCL
uniref:Glycosyltransferase family 92 protein n=1 Tax=Panagrolaimus sp. PS1159 TaxID=55785 RepID=A0AC35GAP6_9BILA